MHLPRPLLYLLKLPLYPLSLLYCAVTGLRNLLYDRGLLRASRFSLPVISVGNLSTGGTGKTPHIEYLIRMLGDQYRLATLSRGYKRRTKGFVLAGEGVDATQIGDEPMQFFRKFPQVAVSVSEDRLTGIPALLEQRPETEVVLLDDAFQHRPVKPGLHILLTDYSRPFYEDHVLPFGSLRESRSGSRRADVIIVSKCPAALSAAQKEAICQKIAPVPGQSVFFSHITYGPLTDFFTGQAMTLPAETAVIMVSGIAKPEPMQQYLRQQAGRVVLQRFPDHHYFSRQDMERIGEACVKAGGEQVMVVTTEKDATRLAMHKDIIRRWQVPVAVLPVIISLGDERAAFDAVIRHYIDQEKKAGDPDALA